MYSGIWPHTLKKYLLLNSKTDVSVLNVHKLPVNLYTVSVLWKTGDAHYGRFVGLGFFFLFFLALYIYCYIFAKGNSEKTLFLQTGQVVNVCNSSYFLGIIFHDLQVHLLNETSSLKTICSNTSVLLVFILLKPPRSLASLLVCCFRQKHQKYEMYVQIAIIYTNSSFRYAFFPDIKPTICLFGEGSCVFKSKAKTNVQVSWLPPSQTFLRRLCGPPGQDSRLCLPRSQALNTGV